MSEKFIIADFAPVPLVVHRVVHYPCYIFDPRPQPLSEQAIASALAEHKRVFIDVTADWCVTCKANKYNVLLRDDVQQALLAPDVVALRGDWSRPSATISQFLTTRGSAAVPFNQIYGPGLPQGEILPALLDREHLLATLSVAQGK